MPLQNKWVKYIDRTYTQIKDSVLVRMKTAIPEITDLTEGNIFVKLISVWSGLMEMIGYYIDNAARESLLLKARLYESVIQIAKANNYRVKTKSYASVDLLFTLDNPAATPVVFGLNSEVTDSSGTIRFFTSAVGTIGVGETQVLIPSIQGVQQTNIAVGTTTGIINESMIIGDIFVADNTLVVRVGGVTWSRVESLGYSNGTDTHFIQTIDKDKNPIIQFGDDVNGAVPTNGSVIEVDYKTTLGDLGNVPANTITTHAITPPVGYILTITNPIAATGGSDFESIEKLRYRVPRATRTLLRMVTRQDYIDVTELATGVALVGVVHDCGKDVDIYIVPEGGGIASTQLITDTGNFIEDKRLIAVGVNVKAAGEVNIILDIDVKVNANESNVVVANRVTNNLADFLSVLNQKIFGTVYLSDIYNVIEETEGVRNSVINLINTIPFARAVTTTTALDWTRAVLSQSNSIVKWRIRIISATQYQLFKDGSFIAAYDLDVLVVQNEVQFTVIDSVTYSINDEWEFYTYPYQANTLAIVEPSLPVAIADNITVNATGGL